MFSIQNVIDLIPSLAVIMDFSKLYHRTLFCGCMKDIVGIINGAALGSLDSPMINDSLGPTIKHLPSLFNEARFHAFDLWSARKHPDAGLI